jgi:putative membrane protein
MDWNTFASLWSWDPSVIAGTLLLELAYLYFARRASPGKKVLFSSGLVVMFIALESPLETLGDTYLFSAHMLQHLLLILAVPPLLLSGIPPELMESILRIPGISRMESVLGRPVVAWFTGAVTLWAWHLPVFYNATLANESIHILEHLTFLVSATIFWWPMWAPIEGLRLSPIWSVPYMFAGAASSSILGILLTFAKPGLYPAYLHPDDPYGVLNLIRNTWGLNAAADQQYGGLLMWIPGGLVYTLAALGGLARWYAAPEEDLHLKS